MIIKKIVAKNYRTLEDLEVEFNGFYTAISGKNNAGKSNIIKAIRGILYQGSRFRFAGGSIIGLDVFEWKDDVTSWKKDLKENLTIDLTIEINKNGDAAIYKFFTDLVFKESERIVLSEKEFLRIIMIKNSKNETQYSVYLGENEIKEDYPKQEVIKRLRSSQCLIFHNSTNSSFDPFGANVDRVSNFIGANELDTINKKKEELLKIVQRSLKQHQEDLTRLLGNLEDKYEVSLSTEGLNFERETINISLKEKGSDVSLDDWGSGTKNRTLIFLNLLNAKRSQNSTQESDRITPVVIIEEPECFLHPQAQSEFGRVLQDLANELQIQVITTTHSPYLLSFKNPEANILIDRDTRPRSRNVSSFVVKTSEDKWYEPFALALGINEADFGPLKDVIFSNNSKVLLVEGQIDKEYFDYFQKAIHGENALRSDIEIFPYDGADNLNNNILMKFIKSKFSDVVVTVDMDKFDSVKKSVTGIGFIENKDFFSIGKKEEGKDSIEGLIPTISLTKVYSEHPEIVRKATMCIGKAQKSAKSDLKKLLLDSFIIEPIGNDTHNDFYEIVKKINKAFK